MFFFSPFSRRVNVKYSPPLLLLDVELSLTHPANNDTRKIVNNTKESFLAKIISNSPQKQSLIGLYLPLQDLFRHRTNNAINKVAIFKHE